MRAVNRAPVELPHRRRFRAFCSSGSRTGALSMASPSSSRHKSPPRPPNAEAGSARHQIRASPRRALRDRSEALRPRRLPPQGNCRRTSQPAATAMMDRQRCIELVGGRRRRRPVSSHWTGARDMRSKKIPMTARLGHHARPAGAPRRVAVALDHRRGRITETTACCKWPLARRMGRGRQAARGTRLQRHRARPCRSSAWRCRAA